MIKPVEKMEGEDSASPGAARTQIVLESQSAIGSRTGDTSGELVVSNQSDQGYDLEVENSQSEEFRPDGRKYVPYTVKIPSDQLAALQSIWLELKKLYGTHSPDKSGMIQAAIADWLKRWESADRDKLLSELLEIRQDTRKRQYRKGK